MSQRKKKTSNISQSQKNKALDGTFVDHKKYLNVYRYRTMRVIKDIRNGIVNEVDVDKLQNFVQMALALMDRATMVDIDKAWRNAEAMSFLHADMGVEVVDQPLKTYSCVLDSKVQGAANGNPSTGRTDAE